MSSQLTMIIGILTGVVSISGGIYGFFRHIALSNKIKKDKELQDILDRAKEEIEKVKYELDKKITVLEEELYSQKESLTKDIEHMKEIYSSEVSNLSNKIQDLKNEINAQHQSMLALLTRLVGDK